MLTRVYRSTPTNLRRLAAVLKRGDLVAVPTETVYGLAGDATNPAACKKIFRAKARPANDPLIVHVHRLTQARSLTVWNEAAEKLAEHFWPGPLTMVLHKSHLVPAIVTSGQDSVAVRMPRHPDFRRLLKLSDLPLAAPSANRFGYVSPTTSQHVKQGLSGRIGAILEGGPCEIGIESTIVDIRDHQRPVLLRSGSISEDQLTKALGLKLRRRRATSPPSAPALAPGLLKRHYSPRTPVVLHRRLAKEVASDSHEAFVYFGPPDLSNPLPSNHYLLAPDGRCDTAARRLFGLLRKLDNLHFAKIHIELPPAGDPLTPALLDRLTRAAAR